MCAVLATHSNPLASLGGPHIVKYNLRVLPCSVVCAVPATDESWGDITELLDLSAERGAPYAVMQPRSYQ